MVCTRLYVFTCMYFETFHPYEKGKLIGPVSFFICEERFIRTQSQCVCVERSVVNMYPVITNVRDGVSGSVIFGSVTTETSSFFISDQCLFSFVSSTFRPGFLTF